jgi:ABC-type antimicrobial peptide transport system permease subunit
MPAVTGSAVSTTLPMTGSDIVMGFAPDGRAVDPNVRTSASFYGVSPDYFSTLGIKIVRGRGFSERDDERAPTVVVISETMAAKYWPGEDPIGKRVKLSYNNTGPREIVGIAGALAVTRVLDSLLFGVSASDPLTFATVSAALITVLVLAAYLPARRATRVDPIVALRAD